MPELAAGFQSLPVEYQNVIQQAQDQLHLTITPLQVLAGGWSGALVFLVSVASLSPEPIEPRTLSCAPGQWHFTVRAEGDSDDSP